VRARAFVIGFLMEAYDPFDVLAAGSALKGILWVCAGICLHIAGGAASETGQRGSRLETAIVVLSKGLHNIRERVQSWDGASRHGGGQR
jgi:hypothetical protein